MQSLALILVYRARYLAQELVEGKTRVNVELTFIRSPQTQLQMHANGTSYLFGLCL